MTEPLRYLLEIGHGHALSRPIHGFSQLKNGCRRICIRTADRAPDTMNLYTTASEVAW